MIIKHVYSIIHKNKFISITQPQIDRKDIDSILSAAKTGWGSRCYNKIDLFEKKFRKKFNFKFASATSSCTGALHIGLKALGINKNDAYNQYLAYHEGQEGWNRGTYKDKGWLINAAKKVENTSLMYNSQLKKCEKELNNKGLFGFL